MHGKRRGVVRVGVWSAWACGFAVVVGTACGSDDSTRSPRQDQDTAGGGAGADDAGGAAGDGTAPAGGTDSSPSSGAAGGGAEPTPGGAAGIGGAAGVAGDTGATGTAGAAGSAGEDCASVEPVALAGWWTSQCNGYLCNMYIAASGALSNGCTNGQYESGMVEAGGTINTLGEGGPYAAYSTKGTLTRSECGSLTRGYIGQIPPSTGPEVQYSCELTRLPACAATLLEALAGVWDGDCGTETCTTTFTLAGELASSCSNGQGSSGSVNETGAFSDMGGGGGFDDYSTTGVIALNADCKSFLMPYTWQMPPNQGTKHSSQCSYTRHENQ
jgi:hypothetical protein